MDSYSYSRTRPGQELTWRVKIIMGFLLFSRIHLYLDPHCNAKGRASRVLSTVLSSYLQITGGTCDSCAAGTALVLSQLSQWNTRDFSNAAA